MRKIIVNSQGKALLDSNKILAIQDGLLPSGYRELTGITYDGNFHYEDDYHLTGDDTLRFSYRATAAGNVIGCYCGSASESNFSYYHSSSAYVRHDTTLIRPSVSNNTTYTIVFGPTGATGFSSTLTWPKTTFTVDGNFFIGMLDNSSSAHLKGNIYGRVIIDNKKIYVPAENGNGVIGYYELYGEKFITKTGTGTPVSLGYLT